MYAYWQAYHAYEILKAFGIKLLVDLTDKKTVEAILRRKIPMKKVKLMWLPFPHKHKAPEFEGRNSGFDALAFYVHSVDRLNKLTFFVWDDELNYKNSDSTKAIQRYLNNEKRIARITARRFGLTEAGLLDFLQFLCKKYFEYEEDKMDKLVEMLRKDLYHLINLISDGYGITTEEIVKKVGRVTHHFKDTLHVIFPDELSEAKENATFTMKSFLESSPTIKRVYDVTDKDIENFLNYMVNHDLVLFFQTLEQFNKDWFSNEPFAQSGRQSHVIYLSLFLETLLKTIGRTTRDTALQSFFSDQQTFLFTLKGFFKHEPWWSTLRKNWSLTKITDATDIDNLLESTTAKSDFCPTNSDWDNLVKMFLVCGIARNLSAHEHHKLFPLEREVYRLMISQIVSALWFSWKYAEKKGLI